MIDKITEQRIKDAANVVDVIGDFYQLKKKGKDYQCLCPFHEDRHIGSFVVSPGRNHYKCYSCGAGGDSVEFLMQHERLSYVDALRWLAQKYGIFVDEEQKRFEVKTSPVNKPVAQLPSLPMLTLPYSVVAKTTNTANDNLCNWIRSLPWSDQQKERVEKALRTYGVGHSDRYRDGSKVEADKPEWTIFWQIDEKGLVHTGKMLRYHADTGKRYKKEELVYNTDWIHSRMAKAKIIDLDKVEWKPCLFGLHLLRICPDAAINIVESEKTALICTIAYGNMKSNLWMACGGLSNIRREMLQPLIDDGRKIALYPDKDGIKKWEEAAEQIGYKYLQVRGDLIEEIWREEDGPKADIADMLLRIIRSRTRGDPPRKKADDTLKEMIRENPALQELINTFDCIPI